MAEKVFRDAVTQLFAKYGALLKERESLEKALNQSDHALAKLRTQIVSLAALCNDIPKDSELGKFLRESAEMGLTDAIREVMKAHNSDMSPIEVRDGLRQMGYDTTAHKNLQVSINTILKRLVLNGEVDRAVDMKTKKPLNIYRWSPFAGMTSSELAGFLYVDPPPATSKRGSSKKKKSAKRRSRLKDEDIPF